jgi:DNA polymerase-3 subunit delta'
MEILGRLSKYSPGQAFLIKELDGTQLYEQLVKILISAPTIDFESVHVLAVELAAPGSNPRFKLAMELLLGWFSSFITSAAQEIVLPETIEGEQAARERFIAASGLDHWAGLWENISRIYLRAEQVHLDRKQVLLSTYTAIDDLAKV